MAEDLANLLIEEYTNRIKDVATPRLAHPVIPTTVNFELKGKFVHLLKENSFMGRDDEDEHQHVENMVETVDFFNIGGVNKYIATLRVFLATLQGATKTLVKR